jgi:ribA/ribD-fused uncharacterized protein
MTYYYFWLRSPFSQWYPSRFRALSMFVNEEDIISEHIFDNAEQWMMYNKALLFKDFISAKSIINTKNPKKVKALGRKIANFDEEVWNKHREDIVYNGTIHKFTQNPNLKKQLLDITQDFVEASPYDTIWGIGLKVDDPLAKQEATWKGLNLLGKILTKVRNEMSSPSFFALEGFNNNQITFSI